MKPYEDDDDDMELEIVDLGEFENEPKDVWKSSLPSREKSVSPDSHGPLPLWRRRRVQVPFVTAVFCVGLVALLLTSGSWSWFASKFVPQPSITSANTLDMGESCINDAELAPNKEVIAVMERDYCYLPSLSRIEGRTGNARLKLFDAHSKRLLGQFALANTILDIVHKQQLRTEDVSDIYYLTVSWSPDSKKVICAFQLALTPRSSMFVGTLRTLAGLYVLDLPKQAHIYLATDESSAASPSSFMELGLVWDVLTGTQIPQAKRVLETSANTGLQWDGQGHLGQPPAGTLSGIDVGSVHSGEPFTFWQPGRVQVVDMTPERQYVWSASCVSWSRDGRYMAILYWQARISLPGQAPLAPDVLKGASLDQLPVLPAHDKALEMLLRSQSKGLETKTFAWRPDGQVLAMYDHQGERLSLYNANTGALWRVYGVSVSDHNDEAADLIASSVLQWTPDGKTLFLALRTGSMQLWQGDVLPAW
ncbi:hypothetical protein [Ktedonobacter racemifer]|uniref:Uncharacterized protein n=1 Tax=Ktedonobacter racemifer DSM 44963 TaxID=485913 RepID=D6THV2_KTERA|nr:hypothetical protein [Ktedonobacter racemifer]EFH90922.1 hypothetical protein Krac_12564 [Ktedonobacter racemifer DSM 44963]